MAANLETVSSPADYKKDLTAIVTLPSGKKFRLRRPPLHEWRRHGRVPGVFQRMLIEASRKALEASQVTEADQRFKLELDALMSASNGIQELQPAERAALDKFEQDIVLESIVEPRVLAVAVAGNTADTLTLADLTDADFQFIYAYALNNSPDVPVAATDGGTTVEAVATFRDGATRKRAARSGGDVQDLQRKAKRTAWHSR